MRDKAVGGGWLGGRMIISFRGFYIFSFYILSCVYDLLFVLG